MLFFAKNGPEERADRLLSILDAFDDRDACAGFIEAAMHDPEEAQRLIGYADALARIRGDAEIQSLARHPVLSPELAENASCLEEALAVLVAALRDGVPYAEGTPDWRRPFLDMLPQDGSFRVAAPKAEDTPLPPERPNARIPLSEDVSLLVSMRAHWIMSEDTILCGPGKTAIRITPAAHAGRGHGGLHCAVERLLNFRTPASQPSLTIGGYKSRSRAWDLMAAEAEALGLAVAEKGPVPAFEDLEHALEGSDADYVSEF